MRLHYSNRSIYPNLKTIQPAKASTSATLPRTLAYPPFPIHVPSNHDRPTYVLPAPQPNLQQHGAPSSDNDPALELLHIPEINDPAVNVNMTSAQADRELRDLMNGGISTDAGPIDMADARVKGLRDDILLLPHQVIGRAWMRERENTAERRHGGILADDMGLSRGFFLALVDLLIRSSLFRAMAGWEKLSRRSLALLKAALVSLTGKTAGPRRRCEFL